MRRSAMSVKAEAQKAIISALSGISAPVHDVAPQVDSGADAAHPYVALGQMIVTMDDTQSSPAFAVQVRFHTYTATGSRRQCYEIQDEIYTVLHRKTLTMPGFNNYSILREDSDSTVLQDGRVHGVCEYRVLIQSV